jgi:sugar/nucleoside kinase (ribokinase family)
MAADGGERLLRGGVVVVGSAARDVDEHDPRGWRLGGGVTYGALLLGRIGVRTTALIGVDREAAAAHELDLLRRAGVEVIPVPLEHGPVFHNVEAPGGRRQTALAVSDPLPTSSSSIPEVLESCGWLFAPVADELPGAWAEVPGPQAFVAVGWQGLLRELTPGGPVIHLDPERHALLERSQLVAASVAELPRSALLRDVTGLLRPDAELLVTKGRRGGATFGADGRMRRAYAPIPARAAVDPTGAGDVMLAALMAAVLATRSSPDEPTRSRGRHLRFAAAAASVLVEQAGLDAVPSLDAIRARLAAGDAGSQTA